MEIKVHTKNLHLTPRLETYIDKKVERLDRYLSNITEASLELRKEGRNEQPVAQLTIRHRNGTIFRAEDKKQQDIFAAIDEVVDKMYRQVERYKSKRRHKKGGDRWIDLDVAEDLALPAFETDEEPALEAAFDEEEMQIVRRKDVLLNPMLEDEAMEQIDLLGHDFFVFLNGETGRVNVLYKRDDGNYGLLTTDR